MTALLGHLAGDCDRRDARRNSTASVAPGDDGYRLCCRKDGAAVALWTRAQERGRGRFERIVAMLRALPIDSCTNDGEVIVRRPDGHSDFHALRSRDGAARTILVAFDLVEIDGIDLRREPLEARRARLSPRPDRPARPRPRRRAGCRHPLQRRVCRGWRRGVRSGLRARLRRHRVDARRIDLSAGQQRGRLGEDVETGVRAGADTERKREASALRSTRLFERISLREGL